QALVCSWYVKCFAEDTWNQYVFLYSGVIIPISSGHQINRHRSIYILNHWPLSGEQVVWICLPADLRTLDSTLLTQGD
ncbi:hypothetical protein XENOCAPTIV_003120, partial [Xenoophorus captivus]